MKELLSLPVDAMLLLGPTGAGKSPLGDHLARFGFLGRRAHHFDFGAELRFASTGNDPSFSSDEIAIIRGVLEQGLLLEDEHFGIAKKIIHLFIVRRNFSSGDVLILNGLPRHVGQANDISPLARVRTLVVLDCSADDIFCRIQDNVGGDRVGRADDEMGLIEKKLRIYAERTAPLIEHYARSGSRVYRIGITGTTTPEGAYRMLLFLAAANPPISLVAEPPQG